MKHHDVILKTIIMPEWQETGSDSMKKRVFYLLAFLIPFVAMLILCIANGVYPFGSNSFMHCDMYHQYVPFLVEFWRKLHAGENLIYAWNIGLGSDFTAIYGYYLATPTNWLVYFVQEHLIIEFMTFMILIKNALCGLTFSYYLSSRFRTRTPAVLMFSTLYALSGFVAAYNWNHMWMDVIWLTPLVVLGLERLVKERKSTLYCVALTASIFTNYYLSIMLCIFLIFYFFIQLFTNSLKFKEKLATVLRFALYSLWAGGMSAVLLLPVKAAMHSTEFSDISFPKSITFYFNALEMVARHFVNTPKEIGLDHWPNIYCGVLVFVLLPLYAFCSKIPLKQRIAKLSLAAFFLLSFSTNILNFIWHGLNYPDSLPARQSFLYIFLLLTMAFEALIHIREWKLSWVLTALFCGVGVLIACGLLVTTEGFTLSVAVLTWIFLCIYVIIGALYLSVRKWRLFLLWFMVALVVGEGTMNMYVTSVSVVQRGYYATKWENYETLLQETKDVEGFFRYESFCAMTKNDGALAGYPGVSVFSSTTNSQVADYYDAIGLQGTKVSYYTDGLTPFTAALLGVRYTFSEQEEDSAIYRLVAQSGEMYLYENIYTLPMGFVISPDIQEKLDATIENGGTNPIKVQNAMVEAIGLDSSLFLFKGRTSTLKDSQEVSAEVSKSGHYYAYLAGDSGKKVTLSVEEETREYEDVKKNSIIDLGYQKEGSQLIFTPEEEKSLQIWLYCLDEEVLSEVIHVLGSEPLQVTEYRGGYLKGNLHVSEPGTLILSVPLETGWKIYVDGEKTTSEAFGEAMLLLPVDTGEHTVELRYVCAGLGAGIGITAGSLFLFLLTRVIIKRRRSRMGNVIVGQSGGPTAVINASVAGVYSAAKSAGVSKVYGMVYGIQGFLDDKVLDLDDYLDTEEGVELMKRTPAAFLGSCRFKMPSVEQEKAIYEKVLERMEQYQIDTFLYIGGNDSMDTVKMLSEYAAANGRKERFIGVPKTIDNDLPVTDHCPGYGSAAKYIATSLKELIRDNAVYGDYRTAVLIVEIMGRHAGWLTAAAALAEDETCEGVDAIYLPESIFDMEKFLKKLKSLVEKKKTIVIAVSEGIKLADGNFVCELSGSSGGPDAFGHKQLSGCGMILAEWVQKELGYKVRAVELSTLQRAATHIASLTDIKEAFAAGEQGVKAALDGKTGKMVVFRRQAKDAYQCTTEVHDIQEIANLERAFPKEWITEDGCGISEEYKKYARPLILGELQPIYENGTPKHLVRK